MKKTTISSPVFSISSPNLSSTNTTITETVNIFSRTEFADYLFKILYDSFYQYFKGFFKDRGYSSHSIDSRSTTDTDNYLTEELDTLSPYSAGTNGISYVDIVSLYVDASHYCNISKSTIFDISKVQSLVELGIHNDINDIKNQAFLSAQSDFIADYAKALGVIIQEAEMLFNGFNIRSSIIGIDVDSLFSGTVEKVYKVIDGDCSEEYISERSEVYDRENSEKYSQCNSKDNRENRKYHHKLLSTRPIYNYHTDYVNSTATRTELSFIHKILCAVRTKFYNSSKKERKNFNIHMEYSNQRKRYNGLITDKEDDKHYTRLSFEGCNPPKEVHKEGLAKYTEYLLNWKIAEVEREIKKANKKAKELAKKRRVLGCKVGVEFFIRMK